MIPAGKPAGLMVIKKILSPVVKQCGKVLTQLFGVLVQGEPDFEEERPFRESELIKQALELEGALVAETVRLYAEKMTETPELVKGLEEQICECNQRLLSKITFTAIKTKRHEYIPCDIDTSVMNNEGTKKENIGWTYKGCEGYHPIFGYLGAEGYLLSCELRPGSQHCQKGTPEFLKQLLERLPEGVKGKALLFRLDSGNDSEETVKAVLGEDD
jgi:hypothetical protein